MTGNPGCVSGRVANVETEMPLPRKDIGVDGKSRRSASTAVVGEQR